MRLVIAALACAACGSPHNSVEGSVRGATVHPRSVLSFQLDPGHSFGGVVATPEGSTPFHDLVVAVFDTGGGCELLDSFRPASKPAALWLDFNANGGPGPGQYAAGDEHQALTAWFWLPDAGMCEFAKAVGASGELDSTHGNVSGSFDLGFFASDSLQGSFDAIPCGAPPVPLEGCL